MNILNELKSRFEPVLFELVEDAAKYLDMIRPAQDPQHGDYQANFAMPLKGQLNKPPRDIAANIVAKVDVSDMCDEPEIAGPGFINLRLKNDWIVEQLSAMLGDERLGVACVDESKTYVIDYSSPNVAKPMHVGHIRSTVIGDALTRTLRFLGHKVISDNHLGDWGTQFGMIIYGYKNFVDESAFDESPVAELSRLYRIVAPMVDYYEAKDKLPKLEESIPKLKALIDELSPPEGEELNDEDKLSLKALNLQLSNAQKAIKQAKKTIDDYESSPAQLELAKGHEEVPQAVLAETAKLHHGDEENNKLWCEFLPHCLNEIERVYQRLDIKFDEQLGESFYHDQLGGVIEKFDNLGLSQVSNGAICVFLEGFEAPMIIQKQDGAFLYSTTDLATIEYRMNEWKPDALLYVVDHRQGEHFQKLFAAARLWGYTDIEYEHVSFGTVTDKHGKPYKTRSGDTVGLEGLLDDAVSRAHKVVSENDDAKPKGPELSDDERQHIADVVGHASIKYADLSHNRTSDYKFDEKKMVAMEGNTATYMQYSYARIQSIFARGGVDADGVVSSSASLQIEEPAERALAIQLLRFDQALNDVVEDYRPNQLTDYLFATAGEFSRFFNDCHVLKAETDELKESRLKLCDLTGRTIKLGLSLLGIGVVDKM